MAGSWRVGGTEAWRDLQVHDGVLRTTALGRPGAPPLAWTTERELAVVLDASRWRADVPGWRWFAGAGDGGVEQGLHLPGHDDAAWTQTSHLHPYYHVRIEGASWFRARVELPEGERGQPLWIVLGSHDDEDWRSYRLWVDGVEAAAWEPERGWHEPRRVRLDPGDPAYPASAFGGAITLAVEARGIDRTRPWMHEGEQEHYFFQGWLVDQFVASGEAVYRVVDDLAVEDAPPDAGDEPVAEARFTLRSRSAPLAAHVRYAAGPDATVRKEVELVWQGDAPAAVLDVVLEDAAAAAAATAGRGLPLLLDGWFCGIEHPAGLAQGGDARSRLLQLPGVDVPPSGRLSCRPVVAGAARPGEDAAAAFRRYLWARRPRRDHMVTVYSPLGWYDFTNAADPLFELDRGLVEENLAQLDELPERFDVYMFDDVWEPTDPATFRRRTFPDGVAEARAAVDRHGMRSGVWMSPAALHWGWGQAPGVDRAIVGGVARPAGEQGGGPGMLPGGVDPETGAWSWDVVFGFGQTCGARLCLAADPMPALTGAAMQGQVGGLESGALKIDGAIPHCTAVDHGHRPGRYSVEPICDALLEMVRQGREHSPDLFVIWYWGLRSPWWLLAGDVLFDKGIKLEAASPASAPAFELRQAISLNTDQAVRHERLVPLPLMDSLGTWLGKVSWANRIGASWWREALLLDLARGSTVFQLWGDLTLLDDDDRAFLGDVMRFAREQGAAFWGVREVGGDPWAAEPYGYAWPLDDGALVTAYNPSFAPRTLTLDAGALGVAEGAAASELFPFPGAAEGVLGAGAATLELKPFEVRVVRLGGAAAAAASERPSTRPTRALDLAPAVEKAEDGDEVAWTVRSRVTLPDDVAHGDAVVVVARLKRDGQWYYHPEPHAAMELAAVIRGATVEHDAWPTARSANGPGYPNVVFRLPAGRLWSGEELRLRLRARLDADVDLQVEAVLFEPWWQRQRPRFVAEPAVAAAVAR